jgi:hypothetical protein
MRGYNRDIHHVSDLLGSGIDRLNIFMRNLLQDIEHYEQKLIESSYGADGVSDETSGQDDNDVSVEESDGVSSDTSDDEPRFSFSKSKSV